MGRVALPNLKRTSSDAKAANPNLEGTNQAMKRSKAASILLRIL